MLEFPNAKINIGLSIIRRREDGFHDLESLFYPVGMSDILEFISEPTSSDPAGYRFKNSGILLTDPVEKNLCIQAYRLVKKQYAIPSLQIHLHKVIPPGSGLGGGSSNGAFMIRMLSKAFGLGMSEEKMEEMAAELGSDCPFFIRNQPAFATGRGENLLPVEPFLSGYHLVVVHPGIPIKTSEAYSRVTPSGMGTGLFDAIRLPIHEWKYTIRNDFEEQILLDHPEIGKLKELLYRSGALYSSLSGSGSAVYGIFDKAVSLNRIPSEYFTWQGWL